MFKSLALSAALVQVADGARVQRKRDDSGTASGDPAPLVQSSTEAKVDFACDAESLPDWLLTGWDGYCGMDGPKALAMPRACSAAIFDVGPNASAGAVAKCNALAENLRCYEFDVDGGKCPPKSPDPAWVDMAIPFIGAFDVLQGPGDCAPSHCAGGINADAVDLPMPRGTEILASRSGIVRGVVDGFGEGSFPCSAKYRSNIVTIKHDDDTQAEYMHLQAGIKVKVGDRVRQGDLLAYSGNSGCTTEPHLHLHVLNAGRTGTLPMRFTSPCPGIENRELVKGDFLCNDQSCKCHSKQCDDWKVRFKTGWEAFCAAPNWLGKVWQMPPGCSITAWFRGPLAQTLADGTCDFFGMNCTAQDSSSCR